MEQQNALFRGQQNYPKNGLMSRMSRIGSDRYLQKHVFSYFFKISQHRSCHSGHISQY